jgi:hypothetical protein
MEHEAISSTHWGVSDRDLVSDCAEMKTSGILDGVLNHVFCFMEFEL